MIKLLRRLHVLHDWGKWHHNRNIKLLGWGNEILGHKTEYIRFCKHINCRKPKFKRINGRATLRATDTLKTRYENAIEATENIINKLKE